VSPLLLNKVSNEIGLAYKSKPRMTDTKFCGGLKIGSKKSRNRRAVGPCRKSCSGGRSASQKTEREVRHAKHVAAAPLASPKPVSAKII
jgi:hypothetical protein